MYIVFHTNLHLELVCSEFLEPNPQNLNDELLISEDLLCMNTAPGLINEYPYGESRKPVKYENIIKTM